MTQPPLLGFAAYSGTGKTTLLCKLLPLLNQQGLRVGVIKGSHHNFAIDQPGKDSYLLRMAGANPVMLVSPHRRVVITELSDKSDQLSLAEQVALFPDTDLDLLLVEGFKEAAIAKIELHRPVLAKPLLFPNDPQIIAFASDVYMSTPESLPWLDLNQPEQIANFIVEKFCSAVK